MAVALAIAAFVIPLGFDTLAVAIALGLRGIRPLRPALLFTVFEVTMPLVGIGLGRYLGEQVGTLAGYIGGVVVIGVGLHALREALEAHEEVREFSLGTLRGAVAAGLGISTDEIAIGFPLGALGLPVGAVLAAIGVQALLATGGGILIGRRIGAALGYRAARLAGFIAGAAFVLLGIFLIVERIIRR